MEERTYEQLAAEWQTFTERERHFLTALWQGYNGRDWMTRRQLAATLGKPALLPYHVQLLTGLVERGWVRADRRDGHSPVIPWRAVYRLADEIAQRVYQRMSARRGGWFGG